MSDTEIWPLYGICVALAFSFAIILSIMSRRRGLRLIEDWARLHEITIVSIRQPAIVPPWKSGRGWDYFRATLRDRAGAIRKRWIRCPSFGFVCCGKGTDYVDVVE